MSDLERQRQQRADGGPPSTLPPSPHTAVSVTPHPAATLPGDNSVGVVGDPASQGEDTLPSPWDDTLLDIGATLFFAQNEKDLNCLYDQMTKIRGLAQDVRQAIADEQFRLSSQTEQGSPKPQRRTTDDLLNDLT